MKVICLRRQWKQFEVGNTYEVTKTYASKYRGKDYWYHEFTHTPAGIGFRVENFAPFSEIDETEIHEQYQKLNLQ